MRELTVPTWVPPAATAALNKVWNDASLDLDDKARTVLRRLASDRAMHEVWLKLPAERALGAESLLRGAIAYAHWGFELRYSPLRPGDPTPWPISHLAIGHTQFLLATMRVMARSDIAEEAWTRVRGEDCAFDFKTLVAAVEKLPQFYELLDQWDARVFDTLPTVARPKSKGALAILLQGHGAAAARALRQASVPGHCDLGPDGLRPSPGPGPGHRQADLQT